MSIPGSGRSSGEGNGDALQYSYWANPMDRGAGQATVHQVTKKLDATYGLSNNILGGMMRRQSNRDSQCQVDGSALGSAAEWVLPAGKLKAPELQRQSESSSRTG